MSESPHHLRRALRRYRALSAFLGILVLVLTLAAWRTDSEVQAQRLVLLDGDGDPTVVLVAGGKGSTAGLIIQDTEGREIMRLGGPAARLLGGGDHPHRNH